MPRLVLVAEDETASQKLASTIIGQLGHIVRLVQNGRECLDLINEGLRPDLLLLDLEMPVLNGTEVLMALKEQSPIERFPIIVLTSHHHESTVMQAIRLGAVDFIVKPYEPDEFRHRVSEFFFEIAEDRLRNLIENLHIQDKTLAKQPSLRKLLSPGSDLYPITVDSKSLCITLVKGFSPRKIAGASMQEIVLSVQIFRKGRFGWRKVWPPLQDYQKNAVKPPD